MSSPSFVFRKLLLLFGLLLSAQLAWADDAPIASNPEDRPPLPTRVDPPPAAKNCVVVWYRRGSPYNPTNVTVGGYATNSDPLRSPSGTRFFSKINYVSVFINSAVTKANALTKDGDPSSHFFNWSSCPFTNSRDETRSTGAWAPKTTPGHCRPNDLLRALPVAYANYSVYAGTAVPETINAPASATDSRLVPYRLMTNGDAGSEDCFAIFTGMSSPLVVDLKGKGLKFTKPGEHVTFDFGEGKKPSVWLANGSEVAFVALDKNGNGTIDDAQELFGNTTRGPDDKPAPNGFDTLKKYDSNGDNVIDSQDAVYAKLFLWSDTNVNGQSEASELRKLADSGLVSISTAYTGRFDFEDNHGNLSNARSTASFADGSTRFVYDVWFAEADPLGLKDAPGKASAVIPVPKEGQTNYAEIQAGWAKAVIEASFGESEMPYDSGEIQTYRRQDGQVDHHVVTWNHVFDRCRVTADFTADFSRMTGSKGSCS